MKYVYPFLISCIFCAFILNNSLATERSEKIIVVTSKADNGPGTFRQALLDAQSGDSINFDTSVFPPSSPDTIFLTSPLPELLQGNLIVDASNAGIVIDGSGIDIAYVNGLTIRSNDNIIRGLHLINFSQAGIAVVGGAQNNIIGGDRKLGEGPSGQGNMVTGEGSFGIGLYDEGTSFNTIEGNILGTDTQTIKKQASFLQALNIDGASYNSVINNLIGGYWEFGIAIGNMPEGHNIIQGNYIGTDFREEINLGDDGAYGIFLTNSGFNTIGPDNVITNNGLGGIRVSGEIAQRNQISKNSIYNNRRKGIILEEGGNNHLIRPYIFEFDIQAGTLSGNSCPGCTLEIFSDRTDQGKIYEGSVTADSTGLFTFSKGASFSGPCLTATATDNNNNTSPFSPPTPEIIEGKNFLIQESNYQELLQIQPKTTKELPDDIRLQCDVGATPGSIHDLDEYANQALKMGAKLVNTTFNEGEGPINWDVSETDIPPKFDLLIDKLIENGVTINYMIHFWDKEGHAAGEELPNPRFTTEEEIQKFLNYVRLIVGHFKGRAKYYTIWDEPGACGGSPEMDVKCIKPNDYVELAKRVIPVIKEMDPDAKIITGPVVLIHARFHLFTLLRSDAIQLFDVIMTHPFFDQAPDNADRLAYDGELIETFADYYFNYPNLVDSILQTASNQGFEGDYWAQGLSWFTKGVDVPGDADADLVGHTKIQSMKYHARAVVTHLGLDYGISSAVNQTIPDSYIMVSNLFTILAGTSPYDLREEIDCDANGIECYGFSLPNGDMLLAPWINDTAFDYDPGVQATIRLPGIGTRKVFGIDVLDGFEQELITEVENDTMIIRNILVKDYPIILRIASTPVNIKEKEIPCSNTKLDIYPNPFNQSTSIVFEIPEQSSVDIAIYNLQGKKIRTLVSGEFESGTHKTEWTGLDNRVNNVESGIYVIRMISDNKVKIRKCMLLK